MTFLSNMYTGAISSMLLPSQVRRPTSSNPSVVSLAVVLVVMLVLQEGILVAAISRKCHRCNTQSREGVLEPVESAEEPCVSPVLTARFPPSAVLISHMGCLIRLTIAPMGRSGASRWTPSAS